MKYVMECLESGWISSIGDFVTTFEHEFAKEIECEFASTTSSGTTALHLALLALGVGEGDEVIVPSLTFVASANAVIYCGATPVFVDVDEETLNIDPESVSAAITTRTKAVMAVHLYGHPAPIDKLREVIGGRSIAIIEDAAEGLGARLGDTPAGALGDIATFSFFGNKLLTTGEGGMVTTSDPAMDARVRLLRGQGQDPARRYWFLETGFNYRLTNVAAAIGLAQLEQISRLLEDRRRVAMQYQVRLAQFSDRFRLPVELSGARSSWWLYTLVLNSDLQVERDEVMAKMEADGIETRPVFYPMQDMPVFAGHEVNTPRAREASARGISLPTHSDLSEDDIDRVVNALLQAIN
jgi:perosamine synthetase